MKLTLTALFDDDTRAQIRESVLGEARGIARSVLDKTVIEEMRRLVDKYIVHDFGSARQKFQTSLETVVREMVAESFSKGDLEVLVRAEAREAVNVAVADEATGTVRSIAREEIRACFRSLD